MIVKVAHSKAEAIRFERERDRQLSPAERAEAVWDLTCDLFRMGGGDESELRLDRSVARVERRGR